MMIKVLACVGFWLLFWFICWCSTGSDEKNMAGFRSYPDVVQKLVRQHPDFADRAPKSISVNKVMVSNLILFTVLFSILCVALQLTVGFSGSFEVLLYFLIVGEGLNAFDLLVIDLLWWRSTPRIRFSFAPDKNLYQAPDKHVDSFLRGIPVFALVALIVNVLWMLIF